MHRRERNVLIAAALCCVATAARAAVTISSDATQNMVCSAGVCAPTASDAVLNVNDLETLLASGNVMVTTTGSGVQASDIDITATLSWSSASALALDAWRSIAIDEPVSIAGLSGLSLTTDDGGKDGLLSFSQTGNVSFQNLSSQLTINGTPYALVGTIASLASAITTNPRGDYALAGGYDASGDGTYTRSPIVRTFKGEFEGLGNAISNLTIAATSGSNIGLFSKLDHATVRDIGLMSANVSVNHFGITNIGVLAGDDENSRVSGAFVSGTASGHQQSYLGGLVGYSVGGTIALSVSVVAASGGSATGGLVGFVDAGNTIKFSHATGKISGGKRTAAGGLVGENLGEIAQSYSSGDVSAGAEGGAGGLVCTNGGAEGGSITESYATGRISGNGFAFGGVVGVNNTQITQSYSTGAVSGGTYVGGFVGFDASTPGSLTHTYWDTTTSGIKNKSQGAGNIPNDPGIKGKTTAQLQSGLPKGFSKKVWAENPNINGGLPYLLANPPPQ